MIPELALGPLGGCASPAVVLYGILPYEARITSEQKRLFKEAASLQGVTLTDFIVTSVHEAAIRTLEARHVIELSERDQQAFVAAILHPPAPNTELRRAWKRFGRSLNRPRRVRRKSRPR